MIATPAFLALLATAVISAAVSLLFWHRRGVPGGTQLALLMLAVTGWALVAAFEGGAIRLPVKVLWSKLEYLGSGSTVTLFLLFALERSRQRGTNGSASSGSKRLAALWILPLFNLVVAFTNEWHGLLWSGYTHSTLGIHQIVYHHGPAFFVMVCALYIYAIAGIVLLVRGTIRGGVVRRRQNLVVLAAGIAPWVGGLVYALQPAWLDGINITPMCFSMTGLVLAVSLVGMRHFDIAPVARHTLFEVMDDGVLVLDAANRIVDINPAARGFLGVDSAQIGASAEPSLSLWPGLMERCRQARAGHFEIRSSDQPQRVIDARLTPMTERNGAVSGLIVVLRDISPRVSALEGLQLAHDQLQTQLSEISRLQEIVQEQAIHDSLTGLFNRRYLEETLPRELAAARRRSAPVAVILLDVDHFKTVNDTLGHQAGDRTLRRLAALLDDCTREGDIACRYGGDEFVLVLPDTPLADAVDKAEALRVKCCSPAVDDSPLVTISLGVACSPDHGVEGGQLLVVADRALYRAKDQGRNRVCAGFRADA